MKKRILLGTALSGCFLGLFSFTAAVLSQEEKKEETPEEKVVNIEDAEKQSSEAKAEVGYTKEEYDEFQKHLNNPELGARAIGLLQFIKAHPKSKLSEHGMTVLPSLLTELYQKKEMTALASASESYLELKPDDPPALGMAMEAFFAEKDYPKAVKYGDLFYAQKPSVGVAQMMAVAYDQLKNEAKFASYAEKCVAEMPPKDAFFYSAKLSHYYAVTKKDVGRAAVNCQKMLAAFGENEVPPGYTAGTWNQEKAFAYSIIGRNAHDRKQYGGAVAAYNNSLKYFRQNDEAYYYLGMSYWGANDTPSALKAFAKGYSLNKPYSKMCRERLEILYKALHNGSLEGLDAVLRVASAEMK